MTEPHPKSPIDSTNVTINGVPFDKRELKPMKSIEEEEKKSSQSVREIQEDRVRPSRRTKSDTETFYIPVFDNDKVFQRTKSEGTSRIEVHNVITNRDDLRKNSIRSNHSHRSHRSVRSNRSSKDNQNVSHHSHRSHRSVRSNHSHRSHRSHRNHKSYRSGDGRRSVRSHTQTSHRPTHRSLSIRSDGIRFSNRSSIHSISSAEPDEYLESPQETNRRRNLRRLLDTADEENIPDYSILSDEERTRIKKKFKGFLATLQHAYPHIQIPEIEMDETLKDINIRYNEYLKRIHVESSSSDYFILLMIAFMAIECLGSKFLGLDFSNFSKHHLKRIGKYKRILYALGEENYNSDELMASPITQLVFFLSIDMVAFVILGLLSDSIGENMRTCIERGIDFFVTGRRKPIKLTDEKGDPVAPPPVEGFGNLLGSLESGGIKELLSNLGGGNGGGDLMSIISNLMKSFMGNSDKSTEELSEPPFPE
uniref:Uncharacterized protein n=1 Tax=Pithovirus LCPAC403 TaxID=2506596 RepID=A0A481ZBJ0_9VIRU|nr:MAG: uncharacterized protein LCPAC403_04120 [Pithovirus LCPAC403]